MFVRSYENITDEIRALKAVLQNVAGIKSFFTYNKYSVRDIDGAKVNYEHR